MFKFNPIECIIRPNINWAYFQKLNLTYSINETLSPKHLPSVIKRFEFLEKEGLNEYISHLHYGFIIYCPFICLIELSTKTKLSIAVQDTSETEAIKIIICSGDLEQWRNALINICSNHSSRHLRYIFDCVFLFFENEGFGPLFKDYYKKPVGDGTFLLDYRK